MLADTKRGARVKKKLLPGGPWRARPQSAPLGQLLAMAPHLSDQVSALMLHAFSVVVPFLQPLPLSLPSAASQLA